MLGASDIFFWNELVAIAEFMCSNMTFAFERQGEGEYWTGIEQVNDLSIQHGENFVLLQNNEDQLCVRIVLVTRAALESDFWAEIERIQQERLAYHDAPLLIINPVRPDTQDIEMIYEKLAILVNTSRV
ncbi:hypothetical protein ANCDUO_15077 [Ancylostoma duodenale]|uniref:Uncharacterized protein n=1 Tax=Ancylostoma duodenale TaxID=51022 RepID=A0A0C2G786_9BILA|nr:hypothetical protein ANCDUO_15077 [Ancylostoma duodenale]